MFQMCLHFLRGLTSLIVSEVVLYHSPSVKLWLFINSSKPLSEEKYFSSLTGIWLLNLTLKSCALVEESEPVAKVFLSFIRRGLFQQRLCKSELESRESLKMSAVNKHVKFSVSPAGLMLGCLGRWGVRNKMVVKLTARGMGKMT